MKPTTSRLCIFRQLWILPLSTLKEQLGIIFYNYRSLQNATITSSAENKGLCASELGKIDSRFAQGLKFSFGFAKNN
jgi:hypothetical protein